MRVDSTLESRSRPVPAWIFSAGFHFFLVLILALVIKPVKKGVPGGKIRDGGVVLFDDLDSNVTYFEQSELKKTLAESSNAAKGAEADSALSNALPELGSVQSDFPNLLPGETDFGQIGESMGDRIDGADGFLDGISDDYKEGVNHDITTQVFGVQGTGTKFVYVFDRSGSMEGAPLKAAKRQLVESLSRLTEKQQFQIVFYNEYPRAFSIRGKRASLLFATKQNKAAAIKFISAMPAGGLTRHLPALKLAVDFAPDVVFFLTDAEKPVISDTQLDIIDRWNRNAASINSIEFGTATTGVHGNFLMKLAKRNGGKYTYVNIGRLVEE